MAIQTNVTNGTIKQKRKVIVQHEVADKPTLSVSIYEPKQVVAEGTADQVATYDISAQGSSIPFWKRDAKVSKTGFRGALSAAYNAFHNAYHTGGITAEQAEQANGARQMYNTARTQMRELTGHFLQRLLGGKKTVAKTSVEMPVDSLPAEDLEGRL